MNPFATDSPERAQLRTIIQIIFLEDNTGLNTDAHVAALAGEIQEAIEDYIDRNYDPSPWCSGCGAARPEQCDCGPIADHN